MNLNDPSTWTEDDKWVLFAAACWFCGAIRDPEKVELRTGRWSASTALHDLFAALRSKHGDLRTLNDTAQHLIEDHCASVGITNTDAPVTLVDFENEVVSLWSDHKKEVLESALLTDFVKNKNIVDKWSEKYFTV